MYEHLSITFYALIELVIRRLGIVDTDLMAHDEARLSVAGNDHVAQVSIVLLHVALARRETQPLDIVRS